MDFKVKLLSCTENPQTLSVAGALGCFEEKSSAQLLETLQSFSSEERLKKENGVLKNSFGRGHGSIGDQNCFIFSIEDLPRAATFQLCLPEYLSHLQQSLRRAKASRGFYLPEAIKSSKLAERARKILLRSFELYEEMCQAGIPAEDARYLLPLYTKTNIQTAGDARELCHLWLMSQESGIPSIVRAVIEEMISQAKKKAPYLFEKFGFNFERLAWYPAPQLYAPENELIYNLIGKYGDAEVVLIDSNSNLPITEEAVERAVKSRNEAQLANLKHIHFDFLVSMSLACFHQAVRQRSWNHSVESIYDAVRDGIMTIPPSIQKTPFAVLYEKQHYDMIVLFDDLCLCEVSPSEAIGVVPHSLKIVTLIHINGWNTIHSIGKRTCVEAQWEIRNLAWKMAKIVKNKFPVLGKWVGPQCITYGDCPEVKNCGYFQRLQKSK